MPGKGKSSYMDSRFSQGFILSCLPGSDVILKAFPHTALNSVLQKWTSLN